MLEPQAIASQGPDFSPLVMGYWRLMEWGCRHRSGSPLLSTT